jgi:hypothetical protein
MKWLLLCLTILYPSLIRKETYENIDLKKPFAHRFIVQNLASLTLRVYQRDCDFKEVCENTLIFQAPMVVGKDEDEYRSKLGFFKISSWTKFHQDYEGEYRPWNLNPPTSGSNRSLWNKTGPFGWYTAFLEPNAEGQWLHGTIGWGEDGERFIEHIKTNFGSYDRIRSKGCTRVNNQSIAFLRNFVPENSLVLKIYAKEDYSDPLLKKYYKTSRLNYWSYALSKQRQDKGDYVLENFDLPSIEQNPLVYSQVPQKILIKAKEDFVRKQKNYNPYELKRKDFQGKFLVDTGTLQDYKHPSSLNHNFNPIPKYFYESHQVFNPQLADIRKK